MTSRPPVAIAGQWPLPASGVDVSLVVSIVVQVLEKTFEKDPLPPQTLRYQLAVQLGEERGWGGIGRRAGECIQAVMLRGAP